MASHLYFNILLIFLSVCLSVCRLFLSVCLSLSLSIALPLTNCQSIAQGPRSRVGTLELSAGNTIYIALVGLFGIRIR